MRSALEIVVVTGYGYLGMASKKSRVRDSPAFSSVPLRKQFKLNFICLFGMS
jgi:hypothetical protein